MQEKRELPNLFNTKYDCCGCGACLAICPMNNKKKECIEMRIDNEGFYYPIINREVCIKCFRCVNICAFKKNI